MNDDIICPYCGHKYYPDDTSDYVNNTSKEECPECERIFKVYGELVIYFTTEKIDEPCKMCSVCDRIIKRGSTIAWDDEGNEIHSGCYKESEPNWAGGLGE